MLDIHLIRTNPDLVRQAFLRRGQDPAPLEALLGADERRRELLQEVEKLRAQRNRVSEEIGKIKKSGGPSPALGVNDAGEMVAEMRRVGDRIKAIEEHLREVDGEFDRLMLEIPNLPDASTPGGATEDENVIVREWGEPRTFGFEPKPHWEIAVNLDIVDFERATNIAGANFEVFKGAGALLRRALINFMLDLHTKQHRYIEIAPPILARRDSLIASGHLPKFEDDQFHLREHDMFLIPTAESALANLHRNEILDSASLPLRYCAYTPCFRYEKFSAGKESRGLIRQFQFDKVEMFKLVLPETSPDELESLVADAEAIYQALGIPYKLALLCAGEMSMAAAKAYDPMAWFPGTGKWLELSSCSNCLDWQARRANVRFRREKGAKPEFVHTLNGSGLAVGRTFAAILENCQQADGSVVVPEVLRAYMGGVDAIGRAPQADASAQMPGRESADL
jgi:seryl-tRNA synthetase